MQLTTRHLSKLIASKARLLPDELTYLGIDRGVLEIVLMAQTDAARLATAINECRAASAIQRWADRHHELGQLEVTKLYGFALRERVRQTDKLECELVVRELPDWHER